MTDRGAGWRYRIFIMTAPRSKCSDFLFDRPIYLATPATVPDNAVVATRGALVISSRHIIARCEATWQAPCPLVWRLLRDVPNDGATGAMDRAVRRVNTVGKRAVARPGWHRPITRHCLSRSPAAPNARKNVPTAAVTAVSIATSVGSGPRPKVARR
jgi:hypothetical protein